MSIDAPATTPSASCPTCGAPGRMSPFAAAEILNQQAAQQAELAQLRANASASTVAAAATAAAAAAGNAGGPGKP